MRWLFFLAYGCSGLAGLVYEVSWTRLLTLHMGHTTAAASTVVAAFMGGLAAGAAIGGRLVTRLTPRACLLAYIALEAIVALSAIALPYELNALEPLLGWAYRDGAPGALFPVVRILSSLVLLFVPSAALGATYPVAVQWYLSSQTNIGRAGGALYAVNTAGAVLGALAAGFFLIPAVGVSGTIRVGLLATTTAIMLAAVAVRDRYVGSGFSRIATVDRIAERSGSSRTPRGAEVGSGFSRTYPWALAAVVLSISGFASMLYQIVWTRVLALAIGPTTYAFAATLTVFIGGLAIGSAGGTWLAGRTRRAPVWLMTVFAGAALAVVLSSSLAGGWMPRAVARHVASDQDPIGATLSRSSILVAGLALPATIGLGAAFPLALATLGHASTTAARGVGLVYAMNSIAAVAGALVAGFLAIPQLGLQRTLQLVSVSLIGGVLVVVYWGALTERARIAGFLASTAVIAGLILSPPWDHELLASGVYKYAPYVSQSLDVETALKAGSLLYYREGASATVSVKQLTGTRALTIDGKTDASNGSDMLTQKLVAHLPLLLHPKPRDIAIVGLGSGVTLAAALRHPIARADVIEISPEVVEASQFFVQENRRALDDERTRLVLGDARSHLALTTRAYDVIVSEPSNPWIAGVASLFTQEFFTTVRDRLAPGGVLCQWAHAYNIAEADLRSIVATFVSVFPHGTAWLIGQNDVMLVAAKEPLDTRLGDIAGHMTRPGVAEDLREVAVADAFGILSLYVAGPGELRRYSGGGLLQTDDRTALEFSAPRAMNRSDGAANATTLAGLLGNSDAGSERTRPTSGGPETIVRVLSGATAVEWRNRGAMMLRSDMYDTAYDDYRRAVAIDPNDRPAAEGFVRAARMAGRIKPALEFAKTLAAEHPESGAALVSLSKLLAANGEFDQAIETARRASRSHGSEIAGIEQLASLLGSLEEVEQLEPVVEKLQRLAPGRAVTHYYGALAQFLRGNAAAAVEEARRAVDVDPQYAAVYDLLGAAYAKLGQPAAAREAFETSLGHNARDSTAYANLGLLELQASNREAAANYFAEALWLDPLSDTAKQGLAQTRVR